MDTQQNKISTSYSLQQWIQRVEQKLQQQQHEIIELRQTIQQLQQQLTEQCLKPQAPPVYHVEKIEYRFDQLKVDTLEGALHIGMSASDPALKPTHIEELIVDKHVNTSYQLKQPNEPNHSSPTYQSIIEAHSNEALQKYMLEQAPAFIYRTAQQLQIAIDEEHLNRIIEDIGQQLLDRIRFYASEEVLSHQQLTRGEKASRETIEAAKQAVMLKTKRDVDTAIEQYLQSVAKSNEQQ